MSAVLQACNTSPKKTLVSGPHAAKRNVVNAALGLAIQELLVGHLQVAVCLDEFQHREHFFCRRLLFETGCER